MSNDRTNMYEIMNDWIDKIGPKYFDMDDVSLNRLGLFGYLNEVMGQNTESIVNENSILYNELFFKRAVLPQSIYAYASHYGLEDLTATPAVMNFAIGIDTDTLKKKSLEDGNGSYFILDNDSKILINGEIPFMIDYNIEIRIHKDDSDNYIYSARYLNNSAPNPLSNIDETSNPFIKTTKFTSNRTEYLFLYITARQCEKIVVNKNIYSDDYVEYFSFDVGYDSTDGQLADFSVFYKKPNDTIFNQIKKILIDSSSIDEDFCYYQLKDTNKVNISFSTGKRYFRPEFNSELEFEFYNTLGAKGNFQYKGNDVSIVLKSDIYDYTGVIFMANSTSDSLGGLNAKTYEEIKNMVAIKASTCNIIETATDLNKYFADIGNCSSMKFTKKRDDILDRLYGSFILMRDYKDNIVPSNTVDLEVYPKDMIFEENTKRFVFKTGKKIIYKPNERKVIPIDDDYDTTDIDYIYTNPFTLVVNTEPLFTEMYMTSIQQKYNVDYNIITDYVVTNFITSNIEITRNSILENLYHFKFSIRPSVEDSANIPYFADFNDDGYFIRDNNILKVIGIIYNDEGKITNYFNTTMRNADNGNNVYYYEARIETDDYITPYSALRICNDYSKTDNDTREEIRDGVFINYDYKMYYTIGTDDSDGNNMYIPATNLKVGFLVYYKNTKAKDDEFKSLIPNLENYNLANLFKIENDVELITNLTKSMYSSVLCDKDYLNKKYFTVKEVPLVRYDYLTKSDYQISFVRQFTTDFTMIRNALSSIKNSFNICVKLYNTYGKSYYFYVSEDKTNILDKVNLSINLRIKLNENKLLDTSLKDRIRNYISSYIETINLERNFYISNLTKLLENEFSDIEFINFRNINGYGFEVQSIEKNFPESDISSDTPLKDFVPEYLNTNKEYPDDNTVVYSIEIEFV